MHVLWTPQQEMGLSVALLLCTIGFWPVMESGTTCSPRDDDTSGMDQTPVHGCPYLSASMFLLLSFCSIFLLLSFCLYHSASNVLLVSFCFYLSAPCLQAAMLTSLGLFASFNYLLSAFMWSICGRCSTCDNYGWPICDCNGVWDHMQPKEK